MDHVTTDFVSRPRRSARDQDTSIAHDIAYSVGECEFGTVLVARTDVGVCAILMGSDGKQLEGDLAARFPDSTLVFNEPQLRDDLSLVVRFVRTPSVGLDLPLDLRHGTPFQRRVWDALRAIPCGATVTYGALARRIGDPSAARAVASACAANAIALGIPCHRVIRSDGTLSGYRWGVELKRALIKKEAMA
jgi:methylated-DNA-[protein]-cysteine S-methyltransferase/AraC family transcriptional regulator of adaptative response/methylated-DNA-[protein]-cysteine methyltransferase